MKKQKITGEELINLKSVSQLRQLLSEKEIDTTAVDRILDYESDLKLLQIELVKLQQWVLNNRKRVIIIFEGRDAAGKGGIIRRFTEHLNPRSVRQVALNKPTEIERGQWYFRRYVKHLPNRGEIVFFDRSWYNRAVVEPVMGFCDEQQYNQFIHKVPEFEHMLYEDGVTIIKFWLSISKTEQLKRFNSRNESPLKRWKFSPVDQKGQELWDKYTYYKEQMFSKTHASYSPWIIVKTNDKMAARLESIRYVLSQFDYDNKKESNMQLIPDPNIIIRYFRSSRHNKD
ncbi:MAG: polyphosphate kinase 2 [Flavobacteriales bacterium CG11_big_fil_rev_8_21_14_0_20_35_7]|nr:MAG: polyphosphate kinase 2 [Flavobacteriales bacterium CG11_big_fil_rev_8_21_14_0_20_35_7]